MKSKLGCGTPIIIKFYAPLNPINKEVEIEYDYKALGSDDELVRTDDYQYCLKQCYKMCYYVQKVYGQEILKMRAEFSKDENGSVSFILFNMSLNRFGFSMQVRFKQEHWKTKIANMEV